MTKMVNKAYKLFLLEEDMIRFMDDEEKTKELVKEYNKVMDASEFAEFEL